jgi:ketosteroid isomerase-like protein
MKTRILLSAIMILFFVAGIGSYTVKAQEWTPAQKEVWQNVNNYWALMTKGDIAGFMAYFHNDYLGWDNEDPVPSTKEETQKWLQFALQSAKTLIYNIKPLGIRVYGEFAFVHYYYYIVREVEGKQKTDFGRWTDILMKQGDKWVMIGDHGGSVKTEE